MTIKKLIHLNFLSFLLLASSTVSAAIVGFDDPDISVNVGATFSLNIIGDSFISDVDGGGINLNFDKSILRIDSVSINTSLWEFLPQNGVISNADGLVSEIQFNTFSQHNKGTFNIATLQFTALGAGSSFLMLSESENNPFASGGEAISPTFLSGKVTVSAVPIPAALWLMASGLGVFGFSGRRNN